VQDTDDLRYLIGVVNNTGYRKNYRPKIIDMPVSSLP